MGRHTQFLTTMLVVMYQCIALYLLVIGFKLVDIECLEAALLTDDNQKFSNTIGMFLFGKILSKTTISVVHLLTLSALLTLSSL